MTQRLDLVFIYTTVPDIGAAETLGTHLVNARLAACINIIPQSTAIYEWNGTLEKASEVIVLIKTPAVLAETAIAAARKIHPYTTPLFATLPVHAVNADYLKWALAATGTT